MGSAEEATPSPKPPKLPATTAATPATTAAVQDPAVSLPTAPPPYSTNDWAAAVQAYYSGAAPAPPAFFSPPPVWGPQHMMTPYGAPIPYSPMYHHHPAAMYAHPSAIAPAMYPVADSGSNKSKGGGGAGSGKSGGEGGGGKVTSGSIEDYGSQSGGESGSEGTSGTRDDSAEPQDISRKRPFGDIIAEGENSQRISGTQNNGNTAESSYTGRARTVSKLPVSAPGRAALPSPPPNLNIGMDIWNASQVGTVAAKGITSAIVPAAVGANGIIPEHQWDERELKRERRKQSNRESARRSRLRKQQECEDLAKKVTELNSENSSLKLELEQLNKICKDLEKENATIAEDLSRMSKTGVASEIEGINCNSLSNGPSVSGEDSGHVPQNPVG